MHTTETTRTELDNAISEMADRMCQLDDGAQAMTCSEVDSIARVLVLAGFDGAAADLIRCHAPGDYDEDDSHHELYNLETVEIRDRDDMTRAETAAADYVAAL